jgi:glycolate oxidase FAD binding subunit
MYREQAMPLNGSATANLFRSLLGPEAVRPATPADAIAGIEPQLVLEPANDLQLASALRLASDERLAVIPRGGGSKIGWGRPPARADLVLSTARLNKILEHAASDLTVSVEAGVTIRELQSALSRHNQRLAIDVLWPKSATVGGIVSTNDSGALRLRFGSLRDLIIGVTIALPDGTLASSGGKVVKNVAGYDLPKLVTGAFGTLGVITRANFRLHPLPQLARTYTALARDSAEVQRWIMAIQDSGLAHSALQARFVAGAPPQLDILFEATDAGIAAQAAGLKRIVAPALFTESEPPVWNARQELYSAASAASRAEQGGQQPCAVAKLSLLPTKISETADRIKALADSQQLRPSLVVQATGLAAVLFEGPAPGLHNSLTLLRVELEKSGGSLFLAHGPAEFPAFDPFGTPPDALGVMLSLRDRFDPKRTQNPDRFLA